MAKRPLVLGIVAVALVAAGGAWYMHQSSSHPARTNAADRRSIPAAAPKAMVANAGSAGATGGAAYRQAWAASEGASRREQALVDAAHLGDAAAVDWLVEIISTDEHFAARAGAALGTVANPAAARELEKIATDHLLHPLARANAVKALGASGDTASTKVLASLLEDANAEARVRQEAALSLGTLHDGAAPALLASELESLGVGSGDEAVRIAIIDALGRLDTAEAHAALEHHASAAISQREQVFTRQALGSAPVR